MMLLDQVSMVSLMAVGAYVYFTSGRILVTNIGKLIMGEKACGWSCVLSLAVLVLYTSTYLIMTVK